MSGRFGSLAAAWAEFQKGRPLPDGTDRLAMIAFAAGAAGALNILFVDVAGPDEINFRYKALLDELKRIAMAVAEMEEPA